MLRRSKILVRQLSQRRQFQIETRKPLPLQLSSTVPLPPPKELLIPPDHNDLFVTNVMVNRNGQSMLRYQIPNMRRFAQVFAEARRVCRENESQYIEANRLQYNERYRYRAWGKIPFLPQRKVHMNPCSLFHSHNFGQQAFWTHACLIWVSSFNLQSNLQSTSAFGDKSKQRDQAHHSSLITSSDFLGIAEMAIVPS